MGDNVLALICALKLEIYNICILNFFYILIFCKSLMDKYTGIFLV